MPKIKKDNKNITKSGNGFANMNLILSMRRQSRLKEENKGGFYVSKDPNTIYVGTKPAMSYRAGSDHPLQRV